VRNIVPARLKRGDEVRVVAPARSMNMLSEQTVRNAMDRFDEMGLKVTFGRHVKDIDICRSASANDRLADLHDAFQDENVKMVLTVIGGFNSNQLLEDIDYGLIRQNPKLFCGYSDITALSCAIYVQTGLVTYSGPAFSTFGMLRGIEYTVSSFKEAFFSGEYSIVPSKEWSDDAWFMDQENRTFIPNPGFETINEGRCSGTSIGGNLCTMNLLQGTRFMPSLSGSVLFIEDDEMTFPELFDRNLESITQLPDFSSVRGILIGRFQKASKLSAEMIGEIIKRKKRLRDLPVMANVDFGHTTPHCVLPVGGHVEFDTRQKSITVRQ